MTPGPTPSPTNVSGPIWLPVITPAPTPTSAGNPSQLIANSDNMTDEGEGIKAIKLDAIKKTVLLPSSFMEAIEGEVVRIAKEQATVELSDPSLKALRKAMETAGADGAEVQLYAEQSPHDFTRLANQTLNDDTLSLTAASELFRFGIGITLNANGDDAMNWIALEEPVTLAFKVDVNANPDLLGLYRIGKDGSLHYAGGTYKDGYIFVQVMEYGSYGVLEYDKSFLDVGETMWAFDVIQMLAAKHIVQGGPDAKYHPQGEVTRAEFAAMLVRALGLQGDGGSSFTDVDRNKWYADAVAAASGAGIINGRSDGSFAPDATVTREEMAVMLIRAFKYVGGNASVEYDSNGLNTSGSCLNVSNNVFRSGDSDLIGQLLAVFGDESQISQWAKEAASQALEAGLIKGRGGDRFEPLETLTRAEAAQAIANLLKLIAR